MKRTHWNHLVLVLFPLACSQDTAAPRYMGPRPLFSLGAGGPADTTCDFGVAWALSSSQHFDSAAFTFQDGAHQPRSKCGNLAFTGDSAFVRLRWIPSLPDANKTNYWQDKYRQTNSAFSDSMAVPFQRYVAQGTWADTTLKLALDPRFDAIGMREFAGGGVAPDPATFDLACDNACVQHWRQINAPILDSLRVTNGTSVHVFWTNSTPAPRSIDSVEVYRDGVRVTATGGTTNNYTDGPLTAGTHAYQIRRTSPRSPHASELAANPNSPFSAESTITAGGPAPPTNLSCQGNFAPIMDCAWTITVPSAQTQVFRNDTLKATLASGVSTWTDPAVVRGSTYTYKVRHLDNVGPGAFGSPILATANPVPPSGLACTALTSRTTHCSWTDGEPAETTAVQRLPSGGSWRVIAATGPSVASYTDADTALHASVTYTYRVYHRHGADSSAFSGVSTLTTLAPASPGLLDCIGHFDPVITCNWGNAEPRDSTKLYRNNGLLATLVAGQTGYNDWSVTPGATYKYTARYKDLSVLGDSAIDTTTKAAVEAPRGFACSGDANGTSALCIWVTLEPADSMELWRALDSGFAHGKVVMIIAPGVTSHTDNNLQNGTTYYYKIRHRRSATNTSAFTPWATAVPGSPNPLRPGG